MARYINAAQKTKTKLRETFWQLYLDKPIEKISVREIVEEAHYNRSTFYEYYSDVYAVLEEIEEALFDELFGNKNQLVLNYQLSFDELIFDIAQTYKRHKKYLRVLLGEHGDPQFVDKVKAHLKSLLRPLIDLTNIIAPENVEYFMEFLTNGLIGMLMYWQKYDSSLSIEDFLKKCKEIIIPEKIISLTTPSGAL